MSPILPLLLFAFLSLRSCVFFSCEHLYFFLLFNLSLFVMLPLNPNGPSVLFFLIQLSLALLSLRLFLHICLHLHQPGKHIRTFVSLFHPNVAWSPFSIAAKCPPIFEEPFPNFCLHFLQICGFFLRRNYRFASAHALKSCLKQYEYMPLSNKK